MIQAMVDFVGGSTNFLLILLYVYVFVVNYKGEKMSGTGWFRSFILALTWPIFVWKMLKKLYEVRD